MAFFAMMACWPHLPQASGSQSVESGPELLEKQILRPQHRPIESETPGVQPKHLF